MARRKTHEEFVAEVRELVGGEYEVVGNYVNTGVKIEMKHTECGYVYEVTPNKFLSAGRRCPKCKGGIKKDEEQFKQEVKELVGNEYEVIGEYKSTMSKIKMKHVTCGYVWEITPNNFLNGNRCLKCNGNPKKDTDKFKLEVKELVENEYEVIGMYVTSKIKIKMKHNECGYVWEVYPNQFLRGSRCPKCVSSKTEKSISEFMKCNDISFESQYKSDECKCKRTLPFDFKVGNIFIEYDGEQHFSPQDFAGKGLRWAEGLFEETKKRDNIKNQYCIDNDIPLVRIPYWEKDNVEYILENVLAYFNIKESNNNIDKELVERYLVDSNWNHNEYLSMQYV